MSGLLLCVKKHGFDIEGELRAYGYKAGTYVNAYSMGRLKEP
jgi:hypothetical protein